MKSVTRTAQNFAGIIRRQWERDSTLIIWSAVLVAILLVSLLGPFFLAPPNQQAPLDRLQGPSAAHWLGTDDFGRDILSRVVSAGRVSLAIGAVITIISIVLGTFIGLVAGYYQSASAVLMRLMDALMSFPAIVLAIALVVALDSQSGAIAETIALTVVFVPYVARVMRSRTIALAQRGFVTAAKASGVRGPRILLIHILPNAVPTVLVQATFVYASALLADASLSFLGLGVPPPTASWGNMIADAKVYISSAPLFIIVPGLAIVLSVMAFNLTGDSIRTLIDPRAKAVVDLQSLKKRIASGRRR